MVNLESRCLSALDPVVLVSAAVVECELVETIDQEVICQDERCFWHLQWTLERLAIVKRSRC